MPGMFGVVGMTSELRARCCDAFVAPWGACEIEKTTSATIGAHCHTQSALVQESSRLIAADGEVSLYARLAQSPTSLWTSDASGIHLAAACRGNLAVWTENKGQLAIASEWTGAFPLYYAHQPGRGFLFASRMSVIASALHPALDAVGLVEFLRDASYQSGRSLWKGVYRLQPGQSLLYDTAEDRLITSERSRLWASVDVGDQGLEQILTETWSRLGGAVDVDRPTSLMMSGGWDSRTLLARLVASMPPGQLMAYSHGDPGSREIRLAQRIAGESGIAFHQEPIDERSYELDDLRLGFDREEHIVFPHWHRAGRLAAAMGSRIVTAGVYGEVLGGHYGRAMLLHGSAKIREVFFGLVRKRTPSPDASPAQLAALMEFLHISRLDRPWPIREDWWQEERIDAGELNADVDRDVSRLRRRGVHSIDELIEAYVSENRGSQYIDAQIRSCRAFTDVSLPFTDRDLLEWATRLPLGVKIHNRLNQKLLRRFAPRLLQYPMAATLASARRPLLAQEASRFVRKGLELGRWRAHFASSGRVAAPRLSWVNFEFLRTSCTLQPIVEDLRSDLWDKAAIMARVEQLAGGNSVPAHPMSDQIMKIYTIDLALRAGAARGLNRANGLPERTVTARAGSRGPQ